MGADDHDFFFHRDDSGLGHIIGVHGRLHRRSAMFFRTLVNQFLPRQIRDYIVNAILGLFHRGSSPPRKMTIFVEMFNEYGYTNQIFEAAEIYLGTRACLSTDRIRLRQESKLNKYLTVCVDRGEEVVDIYEGIQVERNCTQGSDDQKGRNKAGHPMFVLPFPMEYKDRVVGSHLPYILREAEALKEKTKGLRLGNRSKAVNLDHPSTFDTLAMDPIEKSAIIADLDRFLRRKDF